jgi:hypothetical protein
MEEKPDPALGGLAAVVLIGFLLVVLVPFIFIKGLSGTITYVAGLIVVIGVLVAAASSAVWLNRRIPRRAALVLWPCVGAATFLLPRVLIGPPAGGAWLLLLIPLFAALTGFFQALWPNA